MDLDSRNYRAICRAEQRSMAPPASPCDTCDRDCCLGCEHRPAREADWQTCFECGRMCEKMAEGPE